MSDETKEKKEIPLEQAFRFCIDERGNPYFIRVEVRGIAKFACYWFVILSAIGLVLGLWAAILHP